MKSPVVKRSIVIAGHKTSVSLEKAFWSGLKEIARSDNITLSKMVGNIDKHRHRGNLSSALRLFVLNRVVLDRARKPRSSGDNDGAFRLNGARTLAYSSDIGL